MATQGNWLGKWLGSWFGAAESSDTSAAEATLVGVSATANVGVLQAGDLSRRSHRSVRFVPYREGTAYLQGVNAPTTVGTLTAFGVSVAYKPMSFSANVFLRSQRANTAVGKLGVSAGAAVKLRGVSAQTKLRTPHSSAASVVRMTGVKAIARCGTVAFSGGATAKIPWTEEAEVFVGDLKAAGIQNPTDEELALVARLLTRNNASRTMRSNH